MKWFDKLFKSSKPSSETKQSEHTTDASPTGGVKILKKTEDGSLRESKGNVADVAPLFLMAHSKYQSVMAAARSNCMTAMHERELLEAVDLFTKVIELDGKRGEPYGQRGGLYMVYAQINRDRAFLDKAERDYRKALEVGGSDPSNHSIWLNSISQIGTLKGMI
jgi:Flp pilus assembly protein TadD